MSIYRRVLRYYRPFLGQTILGLFLSLLGVGLNLLKPWPFKLIVDDFLRPGAAVRSDWRTWIPLLCLSLVVIQLFWGMMNWITNYLFVKIGLQALLKLRTDHAIYMAESGRFNVVGMGDDQIDRFIAAVIGAMDS